MENKAAAEGPPPKKRRTMNEGPQAEDMSLVTSTNEDDGIEAVPIDSDMAGTTNLENEEEENEQETENSLAQVTTMKSTEPSTKLKDLFAPREEEGKCFQIYCN